jgi:hypothetical protein
LVQVKSRVFQFHQELLQCSRLVLVVEVEHVMLIPIDHRTRGVDLAAVVVPLALDHLQLLQVEDKDL